jgi:uncharacterized delta-60 repeat protein
MSYAMPRSARAVLALAVVAVALLAASARCTPARGASSSTIVGATVPSATSLDVAGCPPGVIGTTHFGVVTPGSSVVTGADCVVQFGSSNDSSQLRVVQADRSGAGMYVPPDGTLDAAFGTSGLATVDFAGGADQGWSAAVDASGRLLVAGDCAMGATAEDLCVARLAPDGSLDTSFGGDGRVTVDVGGAADLGRAVLVQPDGKVIVVGLCYMGATSNDFCLVRLEANGDLDTTFDGDGIVTTSIAGAHYPRTAALQDDGRIVIAGHCIVAAINNDMCVARYRVDGSLDTTFDGDGIASVAIAPGNATDFARSVIVQRDGRIVAGGYCDMGPTYGEDWCLARFERDGSLDGTFGTSGTLVVRHAPGNGIDNVWSVVQQPDGRLVVAGRCDMGGASGTDACLMRLLADGSPDPTFGTGGVVLSGRPLSDTAVTAVVEPDGRIVTAGACASGGSTGTDSCVSRYLPNGAPDTSFGAGGTVLRPLAPGAGTDEAWSLVALSDGRLATAGRCDMGGSTGQDLCVARYGNGGAVAPYAAGSSDWSTPGTGHVAACLRAVQDAVATWPTGPAGACPATDGGYWRGLPTVASPVAAAPLGEAGAVARFRFGLRTASDQPPGSYIGPIEFSVVAP